MSWLDAFFNKQIRIAGGTALPPRQYWNFVSGASAADNPATGQTDITFPGGTALTVQEEGVTLGSGSDATTINCVGASCTATGAAATKTLTFTGLFGANPVQCDSIDRSTAGALTIAGAGSNATSVSIGQPLTFGNSPAGTGTIRLQQTSTIYQNDGGSDRAVWTGAAASQTFGSLSTSDGIFQGSNAWLQGSGGTGYIKVQTAGSIVNQTSSWNMSTAPGTASGILFTPTQNGAASIAFGLNCTSAGISQADKTTNSGVGAALTIQAQNETGTTSTGGALNLTSGTGTTVAGNVVVSTGGVAALTITPTSATLPTNTIPLSLTSGSVAATGNIRCGTAAFSIKGLSGATDVTFIQGSSGNITIGDSAGTSNVVLNQVAGAGGFFLGRFGSVDKLTVLTGSIAAAIPIVGDTASSSPYGVHGGFPKAFPSDANYTVLAAEYKFRRIKYNVGAWTAGHTVTYPTAASDAAGYYIEIWNNSGFTITVSSGSGTKTLATGLVQQFFIDATVGVNFASPTYSP